MAIIELFSTIMAKQTAFSVAAALSVAEAELAVDQDKGGRSAFNDEMFFVKNG
ncbi:MAG: hypothetical protein J0H60_21980 [Rhizobiales bacterium]|nr:hypothetical protein [Hyphomicrobiales bacterium]